MKLARKLQMALLCTLGFASANALACYTVYDRANRMVYAGDKPPVDLSRPIHETLPRVFPGGHMVFDANRADCPRSLGTESMALRIESRGSASPLLTDVQTAQQLNVPHANVGAGVAVVPAQVAARLDLPHFTVIPADETALAAARPVDTTAMGAGPAPRTLAPRAPFASPPPRAAGGGSRY